MTTDTNKYSTVFGYYGEDADLLLKQGDTRIPPWLDLQAGDTAEFTFREKARGWTREDLFTSVTGVATMKVFVDGDTALIRQSIPAYKGIWAGELLVPPEGWAGLVTKGWGRPFVVDRIPAQVPDYRLEGTFKSYWGEQFDPNYIFAPRCVAELFDAPFPLPWQQVGSCWLKYVTERNAAGDRLSVTLEYKAQAPNWDHPDWQMWSTRHLAGEEVWLPVC